MAGMKLSPGVFLLGVVAVSAAQAAPFQQSTEPLLPQQPVSIGPANPVVTALIPPPASFAEWLRVMEQDAVAEGVSPETAHDALSHAMLDDRVVTLDQKQPEGTVSFDAYVRRVVSPSRINAGQQQLDKYNDLLREVGARYGVPPKVIVALWGVESSFGHNSGDYNVVDSLMTLAYEGRRAAFFRKELINALRIVDTGHLPATALRGSWAGAMGQCQFIPSTYLHYAVDYDNNGVRDIWSDPKDIFASIANYIAAEGWRGDQDWGREVTLTSEVPSQNIGLEHRASLAAWQQEGVRASDGSALPNLDLQASLIQPDGANGRSFLVYDNFRALMHWNRSTYFATSVGLLADRIGE